MIDIPHFDLPFRLDASGHAMVVEQDSEDDVANCCEAVVRTFKGQRVELPGFGIADPLFIQGGASPSDIRANVEEWEQRADVSAEEGWDLDAFIQKIRLKVAGGDNE